VSSHKRTFMMIDPNYTHPTSVALSIRLKRRATHLAERMGITRAEFMRAAVEEKCDREEAARANP